MSQCLARSSFLCCIGVLAAIGGATATAAPDSPNDALLGNVCDGSEIPEGEPVCEDDYVDVFNGGINSDPPVFSPIACGDTVCGETGNFVSGGLNSRDTDWYLIELTTPTYVTWTVTAAGFSHGITTVDISVPGGAVVGDFAVSVAGEAISVTNLLPAGQWALFVSTSGFTGVPCGSQYAGAVTCGGGACCLSATQCVIVGLEADCAAMGGIYLGEGTSCPHQIRVVNHNGPQDQWSHTIETVGECPQPGGDSGPACTPGPYAVDVWGTSLSPGNNCENFSHPDACPIPADFFGPGSDPFNGVVCFQGVPIGVTALPGFPDPLDFGDADTLVQRSSDPFDRCELPSGNPSEVSIEIIELSLVSVSPIVVTFNGGQDPEQWEVSVNISPGSTQPGGTLTATKTHCNGGTFDSVLAACPTFTFINIGNPQQQLTLDFCNDCDPAGIVMTTAGQPWIHDPGVNVNLTSPVCSDFHPGILELEPDASCDCNNNQVNDTCDIEDGTSLDCDGDGTPDECQAPPPCVADLNGNCAVDFADIFIIIGAWGPCGVPCPEDLSGNGAVDFADILAVIGAFGPCS